MTKYVLAAAVAVSVTCAVPADAQTRRAYTLDDLAKLKTVSDPQVSPDGKWIAYTVGSQDVEKDKRDSDIWMVSVDGSRTIQLTSSKDSESRPRWSPDGKYLAFTSSRGDEEEKKKGAQVWLLNRSGGEAQKQHLSEILSENLTRFMSGKRLYNQIGRDGAIIPD